MDTSQNSTPDAQLPSPPQGMATSHRFWQAIAIAAAALVAALAFGAYSQPELLLNFVGLRYCG